MFTVDNRADDESFVNYIELNINKNKKFKFKFQFNNYTSIAIPSSNSDPSVPALGGDNSASERGTLALEGALDDSNNQKAARDSDHDSSVS